MIVYILFEKGGFDDERVGKVFLDRSAAEKEFEKGRYYRIEDHEVIE